MPRTFARIDVSIWRDPDFLALSAGAQRLYLMLLSQPNLNLAGVLDATPDRWARYAADTAQPDIYKALDELCGAGFILHDPATAEVAIATFLSHDGVLANRNTARGAARQLDQILSATVRDGLFMRMSDAVRTVVETASERRRDGGPDGGRDGGRDAGRDGGPDLRSRSRSHSHPLNQRVQQECATPAMDKEEESRTEGERVSAALQVLAQRDLAGAQARGRAIGNAELYLRRCLQQRRLTDGAAVATLAAEHPQWAPDRLANAVEPPEVVTPPDYQPEGTGLGVVPDFAALRDAAGRPPRSQADAS